MVSIFLKTLNKSNSDIIVYSILEFKGALCPSLLGCDAHSLQLSIQGDLMTTDNYEAGPKRFNFSSKCRKHYRKENHLEALVKVS